MILLKLLLKIHIHKMYHHIATPNYSSCLRWGILGYLCVFSQKKQPEPSFELETALQGKGFWRGWRGQDWHHCSGRMGLWTGIIKCSPRVRSHEEPSAWPTLAMPSSWVDYCLSQLLSKQPGQFVYGRLWSGPAAGEAMTESQGVVATVSPAKKISAKGAGRARGWCSGQNKPVWKSVAGGRVAAQQIWAEWIMKQPSESSPICRRYQQERSQNLSKTHSLPWFYLFPSSQEICFCFWSWAQGLHWELLWRFKIYLLCGKQKMWKI